MAQYSVSTIEMWSQRKIHAKSKSARKLFLDTFRTCSSLEDCYHKIVIQKVYVKETLGFMLLLRDTSICNNHRVFFSILIVISLEMISLVLVETCLNGESYLFTFVLCKFLLLLGQSYLVVSALRKPGDL